MKFIDTSQVAAVLLVASTASAFLLRNPPVQSSHYVPFTTTTTDPASMHFLSIQQRNYRHLQNTNTKCDKFNHRRNTLCVRSSNSYGDTGNGDAAAGSDNTYGNGPRNTQVWVKLPIDDRQWEITLIKVSEGDFIDTIKEAIKNKCSPEFDSVPIFRIQLFKSADDTEPLNALERWNPDVTWGTAAQPLIVKVMRRVAASPWNNSSIDYPDQIEQGKKFLKSIMGDYEDIPDSNGMGVLRNVLDLESGKRIDVVIRSITEAFWRKVIEATDTSRVGALGTPGIGKTTSTCILIRLLLKEQRTVVYRVRRIDNKGYIYMFTPTLDGFPVVKVIREDEFDYRNEEINKSSTYYVVDPGKTKDNCNLDDDFIGKVIIVTSPDNGHWGGSDFEKGRVGVYGKFLYFLVWTLFELSKAAPYFDCNLSVEEIETRYQQMGGIPRHIFASKDKVSAILRSQESAINGLTEHQVQLMALGHTSAAQTLGESQPKSVLMVYECSDPNFEDFSVAVASRRVTYLLVERHIQFLWNLILDQGVTRSTTAWYAFEAYCQNLMLVKPKKEFFDYKQHNGTALEEISHVPVPSLKLGGCTKIKGTIESLVVAAKREENVVFYSLQPTYPLIDFVYRNANKLYAFQVTVGADHTCDPEYLKAAIDEAGSELDFLLHYLTYNSKYHRFVLKPTNPFKNYPDLVRSTRSNDWTIQVIRVPGPEEDHHSRTVKVQGNSIGLTAGQLQAKCGERGLLKSGTKTELQQRLDMIGSKSLLNIVMSTDSDLDSMSIKLEVFTMEALNKVCRSLEIPESSKKTEVIQRLLDFSLMSRGQIPL